MTPQEAFLAVLRHVLGQPIEAAHYTLEDSPMSHGRGLFRFGKMLSEGHYAFIDFQLLYHSDLARFGVKVIQTDQPKAMLPSPQRQEYTLPALLWHYYGVQLLPSEEHWWAYRQQQDLAYSLVEAGQLLFAYGVPWLEGQVDDPAA